MKCLNSSPRKQTALFACRDWIQKSFSGLRTVEWHLIPRCSLQQEADKWVNKTELLWTPAAAQDIGTWLWHRLIITQCCGCAHLKKQSVPRGLCNSLCQCCLEFALPWANHVDRVGPAVSNGLPLLSTYLSHSCLHHPLSIYMISFNSLNSHLRQDIM